MLPSRLRVKLPYSQEGQGTITFTTGTPNVYTPWVLPVMGNGIAPLATDWYTSITGSSPYWSSTITTGDQLLTGLKEYSNFYKYARIYGSSLHLEVYNNTFRAAGSQETSAPIIVSLVPLPLIVANHGIEAQNTPYELDQKSISQLIQYPHFKYRYQGTESNSTVLGHYKAYAKTKTMLGYSKLEDNQGVNCSLTYDSTTGSQYANPDVGWYFYVRADANQLNEATSNTTLTFRYIIKMKFYVELFGYRFLTSDPLV